MQLTTDFTDANSRISDPQNTKTKYYIELPIPQEVNDSNSVTWGEDRMNAIELATLSIAQRFNGNRCRRRGYISTSRYSSI